MTLVRASGAPAPASGGSRVAHHSNKCSNMAAWRAVGTGQGPDSRSGSAAEDRRSRLPRPRPRRRRRPVRPPASPSVRPRWRPHRSRQSPGGGGPPRRRSRRALALRNPHPFPGHSPRRAYNRDDTAGSRCRWTAPLRARGCWSSGVTPNADAGWGASCTWPSCGPSGGPWWTSGWLRSSWYPSAEPARPHDAAPVVGRSGGAQWWGAAAVPERRVTVGPARPTGRTPGHGERRCMT